MKANKKTLMALKSVLENEQESWDKEEMISTIVEETKLLNLNSAELYTDECSITWDGESICVLSNFIDSFSDIFLQKICNMIDSMVGEDISCYSDEEY